jgi:hypothetical protein
VAFLTLLAFAVAAPTVTAPSPERTQLLAELAAACEVRKGELSDMQLVDYAGMLVATLKPVRTCRQQNSRLALRLARSVAEAPSSASGGAYGLLAAFYQGTNGIRADARLARFYRQRAWLLGSRYLNRFDSAEEARAYLSDPETVAFLRDRLARGAPPKERVWLAEALLARRAAGDVAEAQAMLRTPEAGTQAAARLMLAELALEPGASPADIADATVRLRPVAPSLAAGAKARPLILRLARLQLAAANAPEEKWDAIQSFAAAAYAGEAEPLQAFREALGAANEGRESATVAVTAPPPRILGDDYPPSAMRKNLSGVVRLRALVDPRGRIVFTESADPGQPALLVDTVRRVYASRSVPPLTIAERPTPYVWVTAPPVDFRIAE